MWVTIEIPNAEQRIRAEHVNNFLNVECWQDDNTIISLQKEEDGDELLMDFEMSKEDAVRMAEHILTCYKFNKQIKYGNIQKSRRK